MKDHRWLDSVSLFCYQNRNTLVEHAVKMLREMGSTIMENRVRLHSDPESESEAPPPYTLFLMIPSQSPANLCYL